MATQQRISNWVDSVSQSMSAPTTPSSSDHQQYRSRPPYTRPPSHSQHSRSNSASRSHSREPQFYQREPMRQRSHSHSSSRPHPVRSHSYAQPVHSRTYSYAVNLPPPPVPFPVPPPVPLHHPVPSRSRTLPPPGHNIVYHRYDAPHGGPTYVIVPPVYGGAPPQVRMHSAVRIFHSFLFSPKSVALTSFFLLFFVLFCCLVLLAGHANKTVTAATQALVYEFRTLELFLLGPFPKG
jgi:hypothetical protein